MVPHVPPVAVPSAVEYLTVTVWLLGFERVTAKVNDVVPLLPSFADTSSIEIDGNESSFRTVMMLELCAPSVAPPCGFESARFIFSSPSYFVSPIMVTVMFWSAVSPSTQLRVPLAGEAE